MKHNLPQFFSDSYEIGQKKVAQIHFDLASEQMAEAAPEAFSTGYENPDWRAMRRRQFQRGWSEYQRAKSILEALT